MSRRKHSNWKKCAWASLGRETHNLLSVYNSHQLYPIKGQNFIIASPLWCTAIRFVWAQLSELHHLYCCIPNWIEMCTGTLCYVFCTGTKFYSWKGNIFVSLKEVQTVTHWHMNSFSLSFLSFRIISGKPKWVAEKNLNKPTRDNTTCFTLYCTHWYMLGVQQALTECEAFINARLSSYFIRFRYCTVCT